MQCATNPGKSGIAFNSSAVQTQMDMKLHDYVMIGGGIVGISTALHLGKAFPGARVLPPGKESGPARHQTGRNSGGVPPLFHSLPEITVRSFVR